ncbi:hypothetical protein Scep_026511 [Stephania cephalantha]|uniref:Uncharacterized protein n=1 Tax=Stephania cephalantha TaxID=152367 RepID=A0AAP0EQL2_9MAGN
MWRVTVPKGVSTVSGRYGERRYVDPGVSTSRVPPMVPRSEFDNVADQLRQRGEEGTERGGGGEEAGKERRESGIVTIDVSPSGFCWGSWWFGHGGREGCSTMEVEPGRGGDGRGVSPAIDSTGVDTGDQSATKDSVDLDSGIDYGVLECVVRSTPAIKRDQRIRRPVDVVAAWKALPPGEGNRASALKVADEVLKHFTIIGAPAPSGIPTSGATQSQRLSKSGNGGSSKRKGKAPTTS